METVPAHHEPAAHSPAAPVPPRRQAGAVWRIARDFLIALALAACVALVYGRTLEHDFLNFDDDDYVVNNPHVNTGLSRENVAWAFASAHSANWHPLTWVSHMADVEIFGMNPAGHHLTNLLLHAANTLLLFLLLRLTTRAAWRGALVAGLFALHPLHVESVAWIAERKDVLSTFFGFLALLAYAGYARRPGVLRYAAVLLLMLAGLLSKPMLVTWPCLFLLLDYWPLGRVEFSGGLRSVARRWTELVLEKAPLFAFAGGVAVITFYVQREAGAVSELAAHPLPVRVANAAVSYAVYLRQTFYPEPLAVLYPLHPAGLNTLRVAGAGALLAVVSLFALLLMRRLPWFLVGWLWYLGLLVPVIGLVQVGSQAHADRYTYVPLVGVFIVLAWGAAWAAGASRWRRAGVSLLAVAAVAACGVLSHRQLDHWRDSESLFRHALAVTRDNSIAHNNLGMILLERYLVQVERVERDEAPPESVDAQLAAEAYHHLSEAVRIAPDNAEARHNLATVHMLQGRLGEAAAQFEALLKQHGGDPALYINYGAVLMRLGELARADEMARAALELDPENGHARLLRSLIRQTRERVHPSLHQPRTLDEERVNGLGEEAADANP